MIPPAYQRTIIRRGLAGSPMLAVAPSRPDARPLARGRGRGTLPGGLPPRSRHGPRMGSLRPGHAPREIGEKPALLADRGLLVLEERQELVDPQGLVAVSMNEHDAPPRRDLVLGQPGVRSHLDQTVSHDAADQPGIGDQA